MAGNSMIALMLMLLLCFIGMLVMFLFVIRSNTVLSDSIKEATRQQRQALHDIERQLLELSFTVNKGEVKEVCAQYAEFSQVDDLKRKHANAATLPPTSTESPGMNLSANSLNTSNHENGWSLRDSGDLGSLGNLMDYGNQGNKSIYGNKGNQESPMRPKNIVNPESVAKSKKTMNLNYDARHAGHERMGPQMRAGHHKEPATEEMAHTELPKLSL